MCACVRKVRSISVYPPLPPVSYFARSRAVSAWAATNTQACQPVEEPSVEQYARWASRVLEAGGACRSHARLAAESRLVVCIFSPAVSGGSEEAGVAEAAADAETAQSGSGSGGLVEEAEEAEEDEDDDEDEEGDEEDEEDEEEEEVEAEAGVAVAFAGAVLVVAATLARFGAGSLAEGSTAARPPPADDAGRTGDFGAAPAGNLEKKDMMPPFMVLGREGQKKARSRKGNFLDFANQF